MNSQSLPRRLKLLLLPLLALVVVACTQSPPAAVERGGDVPGDPSIGSAAGSDADASRATQVSDEGNVRIEVTWSNSEQLVFLVTMDTHSVELDSYDLRDLARLRTGSDAEIVPSGWDAPKGGHHRSGTLTFPTTDAAGNPVLGEGPHVLEIVIRDVAEVPERSFRWMH
jgi:hypothetical protein